MYVILEDILCGVPYIRLSLPWFIDISFHKDAYMDAFMIDGGGTKVIIGTHPNLRPYLCSVCGFDVFKGGGKWV